MTSVLSFRHFRRIKISLNSFSEGQRMKNPMAEAYDSCVMTIRHWNEKVSCSIVYVAIIAIHNKDNIFSIYFHVRLLTNFPAQE